MKKLLPFILLILCIFAISGCAQNQTSDDVSKIKKIDTKKKVSIRMSGDVLIEAANYQWMQDDYSFGNYFEQIKPYLKGDLVIGNEEVPIGGEELGIAGADFRFNAPSEIAPQLYDVGFDVMTFANNHSYDRGMQGIINTNENLRKNGIETTGSFASEEEQNETLVVERNGVKIAILSYTYDTNQPIPSEQSFAVNKFLNEHHEFDDAHKQQIKEDVEQAQKKADVIFVSMHWGSEFTYELNAQQKEAATYLNELGVDMIIGNHPHTLQSVETLINSQGKETFVIYSLGNFVSGAANVDRASEQFTNMYEVGGIVNCDVMFDTKTKEVTIENKKMIPFIIHFTYGYENFQIIPFIDYREELAAQHYQRAFSTDFNYEYLKAQLMFLYDDNIKWDR